MRPTLAAVVLCLASVEGLADERELDDAGKTPEEVAATPDLPDEPVQGYLGGVSFSLLGDTFAPAVGFHSDGGQHPLLNLGVHGRLAVHGFLLEASVAAAQLDACCNLNVALFGSLGAGWAFRAGRNVALSPTVQFGIGWGNGQTLFLAGVDVPVTLFLGKRAFIEPYVFVGRYFGASSGGDVSSVFAGVRVGVLLASTVDTSDPADTQPARDFTRGVHFALLGGADLTAGVQFDRFTRLSPTAFACIEGRLSINGFILEPTLRIERGGYGDFGVLPGIGLGWSFALSSHLALTPTVRGTVLFGRQTAANLQSGVGVDLPLTIYLGGHAFLEPYVYAGALFTRNALEPTVSVGYRLGAVF